MDWFSPSDTQALMQVRALNRAMKTGAKVLLRSAGLKPWYIAVFEGNGFSAMRVGARLPGACIDRYVFCIMGGFCFVWGVNANMGANVVGSTCMLRLGFVQRLRMWRR